MVKIAFRVDADARVGTGHLMEVCSLISSMRKNDEVQALVISRRSSFARKRLAGINNCRLSFIPSGLSEDREAEVVSAMANGSGCAVMVCDLLNKSRKFYRLLRSFSGALVVILDNDELKEVPADVAVNFSVTQKKAFYSKRSGGTKYLIGPRYFPFNPDISLFPRVSSVGKVKKVFVNMGGGDPYGLTPKILNALRKTGLDLQVNVVIGGAFLSRNLKTIDRIKSALPGSFRFHRDITPRSVYGIMSVSDMALTAAGNTLYELAYFGVPSLIVSHHLLHYKVASEFARRGAGVNLGLGRDLGTNEISDKIRQFVQDDSWRRRLSRNMRRMISGESQRLSGIILKMAQRLDKAGNVRL